MAMNRVSQSLEGLRKNERKIIEFMMVGPSQLQSYPRLKGVFCDWHVMSDRRLRSSLKSLVKQGFLGVIELDNEGRFYGFPNIVNDPFNHSAALQCKFARGNRAVYEKVGVQAATPEEMIERLRNIKEKPVIRPDRRTAKQRTAQVKNYLTMIDWQIEWYRQKTAKRELEERRKEIEAKYQKRVRCP